MKKKLLFFPFLLFSLLGIAQQSLSLYNLSHLNNQSSLNPAYIGDHTFELTLFPISSNAYSNGPTYLDFIGKRESNNVLTYPSERLSLDQNNLFRANASIETFNLVYNQKNWAISLHHAAKSQGIIDYSGALLSVAIQGNAPFIGQNLPLNTDFSVFSYEEVGLGGAIKLGTFQVGGKIKYLSGQAAAITRRGQLSLFTDPDIYQLSLDTDLKIDVAGQAGNGLNEFNFGPIDLNFSEQENVLIQSPNLLFNWNNDLFNFSGNHGVAFDVGFFWQFNQRLALTFSALDIGKINWKDSPRNYTANQTFEFDGLNLGQLTFDGAETFTFNQVQDSLDIIQFNRTTNTFSTTLPAQFYLGIGYDLNENWRLGGTAYYTKFQNNSFSALSLAINYQFHPSVNVGFSYGMMNEDHFLLGLNAALDLGPLQLFALTDNILGAFQVEDSRTLNAKVGISFSFGQSGTQNR